MASERRGNERPDQAPVGETATYLKTGITVLRVLRKHGNLNAGTRHYRAYVGSPNAYDVTSATQFALMVALGCVKVTPCWT